MNSTAEMNAELERINRIVLQESQMIALYRANRKVPTDYQIREDDAQSTIIGAALIVEREYTRRMTKAGLL